MMIYSPSSRFCTPLKSFETSISRFIFLCVFSLFLQNDGQHTDVPCLCILFSGAAGSDGGKCFPSSFFFFLSIGGKCFGFGFSLKDADTVTPGETKWSFLSVHLSSPPTHTHTHTHTYTLNPTPTSPSTPHQTKTNFGRTGEVLCYKWTVRKMPWCKFTDASLCLVCACVCVCVRVCVCVCFPIRGDFEQDVENGYHQHAETCHGEMETFTYSPRESEREREERVVIAIYNLFFMWSET